MRFHLFSIVIAGILLSSCAAILPHSAYLPSALPLPKPVYRGHDTSAFSFSIGYNGLNVPGNESDYSITDDTPSKSGLLSGASGEASWSTVRDFYNFGFGVFGYGGNYILKDSSFTFTNQPYGGIGIKGNFGLSVQSKNITWHAITLQLSFAKDFGKYTEYRDWIYKANSLENDKAIVPGDALATSILFSTQADFFTHKKVGFSYQFGYCFHYYWQQGVHYFSEAFTTGPVLRLNNVLIGYTGYISNNLSGGGDLRLTVMF